MLYQEFTSRTNIYPDSNLFEAIHQEYVEHTDWDKDRFCEAYAANEDGIAEKINREAEQLILKNTEDLRKEQNAKIEKLNSYIENLRKQIEFEEEWRSVDCNYRSPSDPISFSYLTDAAARDVVQHYLKDSVPQNFGIVRDTKVLEINRHGNLRDRGLTKDIRPWSYLENETTTRRDEKACVVFSIAGQEYVLNVRFGEVYVTPLFDYIKNFPVLNIER